jgi:hypothetical protein
VVAPGAEEWWRGVVEQSAEEWWRWALALRRIGKRDHYGHILKGIFTQ